MTIVLLLVGGAIGAPMRYLADLAIGSHHPSRFPWGTFTVNVVGSFILGMTMSAVANGGAPTWLQTLVGTGLCGALTTFSTFGFETVRLFEDGSWFHAWANVSASILAGFAAGVLGWALVGWLG